MGEGPIPQVVFFTYDNGYMLKGMSMNFRKAEEEGRAK
jgi:hypothetical protein